MDDTTGLGSDTGSYSSADAYAAYQGQADQANDLYQASTQAELAGDSYGSAELNVASIDESAQADQSWDQYMGQGEDSGTLGTTDSYSAGEDNTQAFDDYLSS